MSNRIKIKSIKIKGFRGFREEIECSFDDKLTVLIGVNGAGKTTILDALSTFLLWFRNEITGGQIERYNFPAALTSLKNYDVNNQEHSFENELAISLDSNGKDFSDNTFFSMSALKNTNVDVLKYEKDEGKNILYEFTEHIYNSNLSGELKNVPVLAYYGVNSVSTDIEESNGNFIASEIFDAYHNSLESSYFNFKQFFIWFDKQQKIQLQRGQSKFLDKIKQAVVNILTDKSYDFKNLRIVWGEHFDEMIIDKINKQTGEEEKLTVNQLSSGEKTLLALVVDLAHRLCLANPKSEDPLSGNGIVLIDEIDMHLHPKWQQKVVTKLGEIFPNIQFVVTTHSPLVLNGKIYGVSDTFGHDDADDMLRIMGLQSEVRETIKKIHLLLKNNNIAEAKEIRNTITTEGTFAPLLEIDLFINRKERQLNETN